MQTSLGRSEGGVEWETPAAVLAAFAAELAGSGVPLCRELTAMIELDRDIDHDQPVRLTAVVELLQEPMTAAETASTLLLATIAARARDAQLDDETLLRVMALATKIVARFESYVADSVPVEVR